jgi:hypothetical protein
MAQFPQKNDGRQRILLPDEICQNRSEALLNELFYSNGTGLR